MFLSQVFSLILISYGPFFTTAAYGFVLLSSPSMVSAGTGQPTARDSLFENGKSWKYKLETTVLLNNVGATEKNVGFQIECDVILSSLWQFPDSVYHKLLKLEIISPKLFIKSRKAPEPEGFVQHSSKLDTISNYPIYLSWSSGVIHRIYVDEREKLPLLNLKKGIASLLQFQLLDGHSEETDTSGTCSVVYSTIDPRSFSKTKVQCAENVHRKHHNHILTNNVQSNRQTTYQLNVDNNRIDSIVSQEFHQMSVTISKDVGCNLHTIQKLKFLSGDNVNTNQLNGPSIQSVLQKLESSTGAKLIEDNLLIKKERNAATKSTATLAKVIKENREWLMEDKLGTIKSASAFIKVLNSVRESSREEIIKVLKNNDNKDILLQIYDVLGFAQTENAQEAALKLLRLKSENEIDAAERYLWALALAPNPSYNLLTNMLKILQTDTVKNPKLQETLLLTLGAMAHKYANNLENKDNLKIVHKIRDTLLNGLDYCKNDEECVLSHVRALQNLKHASTIPNLIEHVLNGTRKASVAAMKALHAFQKSEWTAELRKICKRVFFNIGAKPFDSSARTLALDIILESKPDNQTLHDLIQFLLINDRAFEVKQYLLQRLRMISEMDPHFRDRVNGIIRNEIKLNNYAVMAQKGLTTAFSRTFSSNPSNNGSLVTIQEINGGILKRGIVDVVLENNGVSQEIFRLGLFAGGLSSFVSSDTENDVDPASDPDEPANAGMELQVLGVQVRPFVFFSGQGELMTHVWSGTASERTPAFQALILLHDHLEEIRLGVGIISEYKSVGGTSFDLSGYIQLSLWNRNAQSWVEKNAGILLNGILQVDSSFVNSKVEYSLSIEPKLNLVSDIDFYSGVALCMQLKQPDTVLKHNIYKVERIPGSKHKLRKSTYKTLKIPGRTYALNRKNNEMCNIIFKDR